jgi:hypothetical protein
VYTSVGIVVVGAAVGAGAGMRGGPPRNDGNAPGARAGQAKSVI